MDDIQGAFRKLTEEIVNQVNPQAIMVPTIKDQLKELVQPGHVVAFRTESGSFYELSMYSDPSYTTLMKLDEEKDGLVSKAIGKAAAGYDRRRDVVGIQITESNGRKYTTSAIVKVWLSYDANTNSSYPEP
jgi:hypothetical protein